MPALKFLERENFARNIRGVDLFCGVGGLTHGMQLAGIDMVLGIDSDPACEYPYSSNNNASFLLNSIENLDAEILNNAYKNAPFKLLAGCAPCQPFSGYNRGQILRKYKRWNLLEHFSRLIIETKPDLVTMENVPRLENEEVFQNFIEVLLSEGFKISKRVINCANYGVPQYRKRLVLLASKLDLIQIIEPTTPNDKQLTVKQAIGDLPTLESGKTCPLDALHQASELSPLNLQRIRASKPAGTWREWDEKLISKCHKKQSGKSYCSVYGRMSWNKPSPTITTQFFGFGNGRFGHPNQDRAISLREGAVIQSFPSSYTFVSENESISKKKIGRLIGNAVPVELGKTVGISIVRHVNNWLDSQEH